MPTCHCSTQDGTHIYWNVYFSVSGRVVGTPLHVLTFLCRATTAATFLLPGYQHDHIIHCSTQSTVHDAVPKTSEHRHVTFSPTWNHRRTSAARQPFTDLYQCYSITAATAGACQHLCESIIHPCTLYKLHTVQCLPQQTAGLSATMPATSCSCSITP